MRSTKNRSKYNESKYKILLLLESGEQAFSPRAISEKTGISFASIKSELTRLTAWGYIWRKENTGKGRHYFLYQNIKPKGIRCLEECKKRRDIEQMTGIPVSLNRKKKIPEELLILYKKLKDME